MGETGTVVYQRQRRRGLTLPQLNAVDLLASGKTDRETAELLGLSRTCVTKWRLYDPVFAAALNQRRAEVWGAGIDRLRCVIPLAIDALAEELAGPNRLKAAIALLQLCRLPADALAVGPTDPEAIVRTVVDERREQSRSPLQGILDAGNGLPEYQEQVEDTWEELELRANEPDAALPSEGAP